MQSSSLLLKIRGHLLRCCAQINPQRIKDTPAVNLCSRLVSTPPIFKRLTAKRLFRSGTDAAGSARQRCFCVAKTRVRKCTRMYTSGQAICKRLTESGDFQKANGKKAFLTGIARLKNDYIYLIFVSVNNLRKRGFNYG